MQPYEIVLFNYNRCYYNCDNRSNNITQRKEENVLQASGIFSDSFLRMIILMKNMRAFPTFLKNTLKDGEDYIDDITWNDLDMDKIFMMIDNTHSSVGRDGLYKLLRKPVTDKAELEKREQLIEYF